MFKNNLNVVYIQTPFHLDVFNKIFNSLIFTTEKWIIFCDLLVLDSTTNKFIGFKNVQIEVVDLNLSLKHSGVNGKWDRLKNIPIMRKKVLNYIKMAKFIITNNEIENLVVFSEKNLFSQIMLKYIPINTVVWSVDEGFGHYVMPNQGDGVKKIFYPFLCYIAFAFPYQYFRVLGTHKRINNVVLRLPLMRELQNRGLTILSFQDLGISHTKKGYKKEDVSKGTVLVITLPYETLPFYSERMCLLKNTINCLQDNGYIVDIKPHPREDVSKYQYLNVLDKNVAIENLDYCKYEYIVSDISSSMINVFESDYPKENIFILNLEYFPSLSVFFTNLTVLDENNTIEQYL